MPHRETAIRHLAASRTGSVLAAAEFKQRVYLYDLQTLERAHTLQTTLDFGGRRLAISDDGRTVIVGAYERSGIAAYSGHDGRELWRRKDLKKVQNIHFSADNTRVFCCFDSRPCESLNPATGRSGMSLRAVRAIWESAYAPVRFLVRPRDYAIGDFEAPIASIPRVSFYVLSADFSPTLVCVTEAGGPVRAFDTSSGAEVWRHTPAQGTHFLQVAFCAGLRSFVGVSWPFERGGQNLLQRFSSDNGSPTVVCDVGPAAELEFCQRGARLVTDAGSVFDVASGGKVASLLFPDAPPRGNSP
jgi:WD40 repeat protein